MRTSCLACMQRCIPQINVSHISFAFIPYHLSVYLSLSLWVCLCSVFAFHVLACIISHKFNGFPWTSSISCPCFEYDYPCDHHHYISSIYNTALVGSVGNAHTPHMHWDDSWTVFDQLNSGADCLSSQQINCPFSLFISVYLVHAYLVLIFAMRQYYCVCVWRWHWSFVALIVTSENQFNCNCLQKVALICPFVHHMDTNCCAFFSAVPTGGLPSKRNWKLINSILHCISVVMYDIFTRDLDEKCICWGDTCSFPYVFPPQLVHPSFH